MTKIRRKIAAGITAAAMAMAISVTAYAAGPAGPAGQPQGGGAPAMTQEAAGGNGQNMQAAEDNGQQLPPDGGQNMQKPEAPQNNGAPAMQQGDRPDSIPGGREKPADDNINKVLHAVEQMEDADAKTNLQSLLEAHRTAAQQAQSAGDEDARKAADEALEKAREAVNSALTEAGLDVAIEKPADKAQGQNVTDEKPADKAQEQKNSVSVKPAQQDGTAAADQTTKSAQTDQKEKNAQAGQENKSAQRDSEGLFAAFMRWVQAFLRRA